MTSQEAVAFLASKRRTVLLGGLAVILHGLSRNTKDYDVWLDPLPDVQSWAAPIQQLLTREPSLQARRISAFEGWKPVIVGDVPVVGAEDRLIRIVGNERPIDVFYIPNELEAADFERYVVAEHDEVNILENQVEQDGLGVLMRFHPVASDLREFISAMKISTK
jgi:hypothetical protein